MPSDADQGPDEAERAVLAAYEEEDFVPGEPLTPQSDDFRRQEAESKAESQESCEQQQPSQPSKSSDTPQPPSLSFGQASTESLPALFFSGTAWVRHSDHHTRPSSQ